MLTLIHLFGAVALLIWGTHMVQIGILRAYGAGLRRLMGHCANNRLYAFSIGLFITALIQSSTATTLMISSFVAQGLIQTQAALALVLGAGVGTSLIAQFFSLKMEWLSPALILLGVILFRANRSDSTHNAGRAAIGLGLMMLALQLIGLAMRPVSESAGVKVIFESLTGDLVLDLLFAALLTVLAHSSLAIVLVVVSLVVAHSLSPTLGLALVLGANLGSTLSPLLSSWSSGNEVRRAPLANLVFKLVGCVMVTPFLAKIAAELALLDVDPGQQMLYFHTVFNLLNSVIFLCLIGPVTRWSERLLPQQPNANNALQPRYLDAAVIETPEVAVACAAREALRIGDLIDQMLRQMQMVFRDNDEKLLRDIESLENGVDTLYSAIKFYLTQIDREGLSAHDNQRWADIIALTINLEHIGDIIDHNLVDLGRRKMRGQLSFSETGANEIDEMFQRLISNLRLGLNLFMHPEVKSAQQLIEEKSRFNALERLYAENHLKRLTENRLQSIETSALHLDVIRDLRRINSHICALAYPILDAAGLLMKNRLRQETLPEREAPASRTKYRVEPESPY